MMDSAVLPKQNIALQLSSGTYKLLAITPNTTVSLGKFGSFYSNQIIGRPFHVTYEILSEPDADGYGLRIVPAAELNAEALISEGSGEADGLSEDADPGTPEQPADNREIVDDGSTQKLTLDEIEELKKNSTGAGQEIIAKLLESHSSIDKKTAFSLAKYKLRKEKKYLKRFTVLPLDANLLADCLIDRREAHRILELRHEMIGLLGCWANVHHSGNLRLENIKPSGRYLVVDDTGGIVVAAMAERLGILHPSSQEDDDENQDEKESANTTEAKANERKAPPKTSTRFKNDGMNAEENTITLIHAYTQPNLALLKHFGFDVDEPDRSHPLYDHLKTLSWLQVIDPDSDNIYSEKPEAVDEEALKKLKPRQRGTYHRKQSRWARVRRIVDEVRAGGYDGLVVASLMEPHTILKHAVPLLAGGASVAVYSPTVESLTHLMDLYSTARRTAYINRKLDLEKEQQNKTASTNSEAMQVDDSSPSIEAQLSSEFPVDPTLVLAPMLQTSRVRDWQVLPGRTHPLMTGRGGAEGYIFHGIRAVPNTGRIQARGIANRKKRKLDTLTTDTSTPEEMSTSAVA